MANGTSVHHRRFLAGETVMDMDPTPKKDNLAFFGTDVFAWLLGASQVALAVGTSLAVLVGD
jgi:hypothetical protein